MIPEEWSEVDASNAQVRKRLHDRLEQAMENNAESRIDRKVRMLHNEACVRELQFEGKIVKSSPSGSLLADAQRTPFTSAESTPTESRDIETLDFEADMIAAYGSAGSSERNERDEAIRILDSLSALIGNQEEQESKE